MEFAWLIVIGFLSGIISAFFGIGGGLIIVPSLLLVYPQLPYSTVIGCSFGIIFLNTIINTYNFSKHGQLLPLAFLRNFVIGVLPGVLLGTYLVTLWPTNISKKIFATFLLFLVIYNQFKKSESHGEMNLEGRNFIKIMAGFSAGIIAGLTGVGGGTVLIPVFLNVFHIPPKKISPASNSIMIFLTGIALMRMMMGVNPGLPLFNIFQVGSVNFLIVLIVFVGAFITSRLGVKLNSLCDDKLKKKIFSLLLLLLSFKLYWS